MRKLSDYELNAIKAKYTSVGSKLSCAIYARKSKEDKSQQALNVQIETCLAVIEDNKKYLQHRKTYQEDNVSGYSVKGRDEFLALLSAIEDVLANRIEEEINREYEKKIGRTTKSEFRSWMNSMNYMSNAMLAD